MSEQLRNPIAEFARQQKLAPVSFISEFERTEIQKTKEGFDVGGEAFSDEEVASKLDEILGKLGIRKNLFQT